MPQPAASGVRLAMAGVGLKACHVDGLLAGPATAVDFIEVHAENYMVDGGPFLHHLDRVRERWPLSVHGVGLSIGGAQPPCATHLQRLARVLQRFEPRWFSEHLAWSSHGGHSFNDLLPLPYNRVTLQRVCDHIDQVQQHLHRRMLLENPSTYVEFADSTMDEGAFLAEVVRRTGCGLLLDVNNAYVSAVNHARDPWALVSALPPQAVGEIHLAGFAEDTDAAGSRLLIDTHGAPVDGPVWALYQRTLQHLGPVPTLIERDQNLPSLAVLLQEAAEARRLQHAVAPAARGAPDTPAARPARGDTASPRPGPAHLEPPHVWPEALLDAHRPVPAGLHTCNGSDPAPRFDVYRNNVVVSLVDVLADTFPVLCQWVGTEFFRAMAREFVCVHPPRTPVMTDYGDGLADWLRDFAPTQPMPCLPDLARLERARVRACHAADARPLTADVLARALAQPERLPALRLGLHPSLQALGSPNAVVSLWAAHQLDDLARDEAIAALDLHAAEAALVLRTPDDTVCVLPVAPADARLAEALRQGLCLADAMAQAQAHVPGDALPGAPGADLSRVLGLLLQHGALITVDGEAPIPNAPL